MIALTANAQTEDRQSIFNAGLDELLLKPLDRERLREILDTACGPGTTDVQIVLPVSAIKQRYLEHFDLSRRAA